MIQYFPVAQQRSPEVYQASWPVFAGTRSEIVAMLRAARESGRLVSYTQPVPCPGAPGRLMVRFLLADNPTPVAAAEPVRRRSPGWVWAAAALVVLLVLAALGWLVFLALAWVAANAAFLAVVAVVATVVLVGGGRCVITLTHRH